MNQSILLRSETKPGEQRTPLIPEDAGALVKMGVSVRVERSARRIFADQLYLEQGCELVAEGRWRTAHDAQYILGLKELPIEEAPIATTHIYFSHSFKGQGEAAQILSRFHRGNGTILDLEYLTHQQGYRCAAFGFWAGYVGAALSLLAFTSRDAQQRPLSAVPKFSTQDELITVVKNALNQSPGQPVPKVIVIGAKGRCGRGASQLLQDVRLTSATLWDVAETAGRSRFPEILEHDIFVNTILLKEAITPFLSKEDLSQPRSLSVVADVSCDPSNPGNPVPIYDAITTIDAPVRNVGTAQHPLDVIAIDHLPSLLPKESSEDYSKQLLPSLIKLFQTGLSDEWGRAESAFHDAMQRVL